MHYHGTWITRVIIFQHSQGNWKKSSKHYWESFIDLTKMSPKQTKEWTPSRIVSLWFIHDYFNRITQDIFWWKQITWKCFVIYHDLLVDILSKYLVQTRSFLAMFLLCDRFPCCLCNSPYLLLPQILTSYVSHFYMLCSTTPSMHTIPNIQNSPPTHRWDWTVWYLGEETFWIKPIW